VQDKMEEFVKEIMNNRLRYGHEVGEDMYKYVIEYLKYGARLTPLALYLKKLKFSGHAEEDYRIDLRYVLLAIIKSELKPKPTMDYAWARRKNAVMAFEKAKENERRQSNSRRRKTRKGQRKNRRATRRSRRNY
jgi:hypothetical protein